MGKSSNKIKDFFYDATDYILIIAILLVVILIIAWRLDALFAKTGPDVDSNSNDTVAEEQEEPKESDDQVSESEEDENQEDQVQEDPEEETSSEDSSVETVSVTIPEGSLPQAIANILSEQGLIDDKISFLQTSRDMELDTEFRPGDYELSENMTVEEIIRIIARQD